MKEYLDGLKNILENGHKCLDRTNTGTLSVFGTLKRYDLRGGKIPLLTTKKMFHRTFIHETLWFISGSTDVAYLKKHNISIWDSWVDPKTAVYQNKTREEIERDIIKKMQWTGNSIQFEVYPQDDPEAQMPDQQYFVDHGYGNPVVFFQQDLCASFINEADGLAADTFDKAVNWLAQQLGVETKKLVSGSIGPGAYGAMWRRMEDIRKVGTHEIQNYVKKGFVVDNAVGNNAYMVRYIDQLGNMIKLLKENPDSRRIIMHAYDSRQVDFCQLPPCHSWVQLRSYALTFEERLELARAQGINFDDVGLLNKHAFASRLDELHIPKRKLKLLIMLRSNDGPVGEPFNMAQYGLLAHMIAQVTNHVAEELIYVQGDHHVYLDQVELVKEQLEREPFEQTAKVKLNPLISRIEDFKFEDIEIVDYDEYHPAIKYPVAV